MGEDKRYIVYDRNGKKLQSAICVCCNREFRAYKYDIERYGKKYCSRECKFRRNKINRWIFREMNEDVAYILGYIWATGQMMDLNEFNMVHKDEEIIKAIHEAFKTDYKIKYVKNKYKLSIYCETIQIDLFNMGVCKYKWNMSYPIIPNIYDSSFIKGFIRASDKKEKDNHFRVAVPSKYMTYALCDKLYCKYIYEDGKWWILLPK